MLVGKFGQHGEQLVPETLTSAVRELEIVYNKYSKDLEFIAEPNDFYKNYIGRPPLLYYAKRMTKDLGGAKIYLKWEDLNHIGFHKINNVLRQVFLAKKMGKTCVIAEADAGQHDVAVTTAAALLGMECGAFIGKEDTDRRALNVFRMQLLGTKAHPVTNGTQILRDAVNETMRKQTNRVEDTHYVSGSVMGLHPFPTTVRSFQSIIEREIREQLLKAEGRLPSMVIVCVGSGSNTIGVFCGSINEPSVALIGCEAAGEGVETGQRAATICRGSLGISHDMKSYFCQDEYGQAAPVYSTSAGLDYSGVGLEYVNLRDAGRASYVPATDGEAVDTLQYLSRTRSVIPAIESAHVVSYAGEVVPGMSKGNIIVINLPGHGDKSVTTVARYMGVNIYE